MSIRDVSAHGSNQIIVTDDLGNRKVIDVNAGVDAQITAHSILTTGVHGVGVSTVASLADIGSDSMIWAIVFGG
jgi:hypothetical protein